MSTTLCFDFGNTRKKVAVFQEKEIVKTLVLQDDTTATIRSLVEAYKPAKSILSSVISHNAEIETVLKDTTRFHLLNHLSRLPITTPVGKPETIGSDRLAIASGGVHFYPGKNLLLIGLGTCITLNFVNKYSELVGGSISPGLEMRLKSMQYYTAKLPLIAPKSDVPLLGYDTETNILSGVILGMAYELDGFIAAYEEKFDNFNVVLTGGDMQHLASHLKSRIFADPELIFKGLYAISEVNNA
ncbi:type III pantothenate kinase [Niabella drilacis]|uniref:Type III pantothenate kinase n=1 Tax=Niabella drilacis (strain DSM 25811 / CCM 8410 / CCUG 62505 / LMG 26954 / E90) TaxID=1285928 RepID=A0A1G6PJY2_NIADE|nr:type III pantothenate kinase [Niabella drilacis]SDC79717.1 type III pantothenate kinase [Niabella drilacis]